MYAKGKTFQYDCVWMLFEKQGRDKVFASVHLKYWNSFCILMWG